MAECILHTGILDKKGYGRTYFEGRLTTAHRAAYCRANDLSLDDIVGKVVRHKCDNPPCVNPEHLEIGTYKDNTKDMLDRGRCSEGERHYISKLSQEQVEEIRARYTWRCPTNGGKALAKEFGVVKSTISNIVNGRTYRVAKPDSVASP